MQQPSKPANPTSISPANSIIMPPNGHRKNSISITLVNLAAVFGFGPEIWLFNRRRHSLQDDRILLYSFILNLQGQCVFLLYVICSILELKISTLPAGGSYQNFLQGTIELVFDAGFIIWLGMILYGCIASVFNPPWPLPGVKWLRTSHLYKKSAIFLAFSTQLFFVVLIGFSARAAYLTRPHPEKASVYLLYQNTINSPIGDIQPPKMIFSLGFYPIAEAAAFRWGDTSIAVEPMSQDSIREALQNGKMIFFATHGGGMPGSIAISTVPYDIFYPAVIPLIGGVNQDLEFVYIAGCDGGQSELEWQKYLSPAKVISFNRTSYVIEHFYWLWFSGPETIRGL